MSEHAQHRFKAPSGRIARFADAVAARLRGDENVFDLGCGSGEQLVALAERFPALKGEGVDISPANVDQAQSLCRQRGLSDRLTFHCVDYMAYSPATLFDVAISYSVLHLIPFDDGRVFKKLASELKPNGLLINVMPVECTYNSMLGLGRRGARILRSPAFESMAMNVARRIHGANYEDDLLRERIHYLYQLPSCSHGGELDAYLERQCGLRCVDRAPEIHASAAQLKHSLCVFQKLA